MKSEAIFNCTYRKEALRLKEILAQRLRQTIGVDSIDNARKCLTIGFESIENTRTGEWFTIILASDRPVEKLDLTEKEMREFLRGVIQGERLAKKAAQEADPLKPRGGLVKMLLAAGKKKRSRKGSGKSICRVASDK